MGGRARTFRRHVDRYHEDGLIDKRISQDVRRRVRVHEHADGRLSVFHGPRRLARYEADGSPAIAS